LKRENASPKDVEKVGYKVSRICSYDYCGKTGCSF